VNAKGPLSWLNQALVNAWDAACRFLIWLRRLVVAIIVAIVALAIFLSVAIIFIHDAWPLWQPICKLCTDAISSCIRLVLPSDVVRNRALAAALIVLLAVMLIHFIGAWKQLKQAIKNLIDRWFGR
jgi:hypothetical protein